MERLYITEMSKLSTVITDLRRFFTW